MCSHPLGSPSQLRGSGEQQEPSRKMGEKVTQYGVSQPRSDAEKNTMGSEGLLFRDSSAASMQPDHISISRARPSLLPMAVQTFRRSSLVVTHPLPEHPPAPPPRHHLAELVVLVPLRDVDRRHPDKIDYEAGGGVRAHGRIVAPPGPIFMAGQPRLKGAQVVCVFPRAVLRWESERRSAKRVWERCALEKER